MIDTSYDADSAVAEYAANSLEFFDPEQVRMQLLSILRERGPSNALGYLFGSRGGIVLSIAAKVVAAALLHLRSSVPADVQASFHVLEALRDHHCHLPQEP